MGASPRIQPARTGNRLLDRLAPADFKRLGRSLEPVSLAARQVLYRPDDLMDYLYFPTTAVLSQLAGALPGEGGGIEISAVGNDGMIEVTALLGVPTSLHLVTCQGQGECLRVPAAVLNEAMRRPAIDALLKRYAAVAYRAAVQSAVCNALHSVEQRFCRWLLAAQDKVTGEFPATHELLAAMLGVKRPTISIVANALQKQGLISYHRGTVRILDRQRLEQSACVCHQLTKAAYSQIIDR